MLTKLQACIDALLTWLDAQLLKLDPKEQERRHQEYFWKIERMTKSIAPPGRYRRRKPDKLCEDDACVERIREAEGS
jgi:hypothetical protein